MPRREYKAGWVWFRLDKLKAAGQFADTATVREALKVRERTLRRWLADPYFKSAAVAVKEGRLHSWNLQKLELWLLAMTGKDRQRKSAVSSNPPKLSTRDEARQMLGIPLDYKMEQS